MSRQEAMTMIASQEALAAWLAGWSDQQVIAVDTEADSLHSYREKLCLVQLATAGECQLVDPLADFSIQPLLDFLSTRTVILHGASYDLRMLMSAGNFTPSSVFDTMLAARMTGRKAFSLAALVTEFCQIELTKASRKADWGKRPLSDAMMAYALNDVRYLHTLKARLTEELQALGRLEWLHQSCAREIQAATVPGDNNRSSREAWRIKGAYRLDARASAVLRELWRWREQEAELRDVPPFKVMRNEDLMKHSEVAAAGSQPKVEHLNRKNLNAVKAAIDKAMQLEDSELPQRKRSERRSKSQHFDCNFETLSTHRNRIAHQLNLEPSFLASRAMLEMLAGDQEQRQQALQKLLPWQLHLLEDAIPKTA